MARHAPRGKRATLAARRMTAAERSEEFMKGVRATKEFRRLGGPPAGNGFYARGGVRIKRIAPVVHYRFDGDGGGQQWCISDMTAAWPLMDELRELVAEYERITQHGKARMLGKRITAKADHINSIAMRRAPLSSVASVSAST